MKKIICKLIWIVALPLLLVSCDDLLEPEVYTTFTSANFPANQKDIDELIADFYNMFNVSYGTWTIAEGQGTWAQSIYSCNDYSWLHVSSACTDEMYDDWVPEFQHKWGSAFDLYAGYYVKVKWVSRATDLISTLEKSDLNEKVKNEAIAEVKCFRAWLMFILYDSFGPIPVILDPSMTGDTIAKPKPPKEEYVNAMIKDFTDAIPNLDKKNNNTKRWGHLNQAVASMLLAKLYMNEQRYADAKPIVESIMNMGYKLNESYKNVFIEDQNDEQIWMAIAKDALASYWYSNNFPSNLKKVAGIEFPNHGGWEGYFMPWEFYDKYPDGDKRLETIGNEYEARDGKIYKRGEGKLSLGAIVVKYCYDPATMGSRIGENSKISLVGFRYADALLMMAEIENELAGPAAAEPYLKQVTDRAGIEIPANAKSSKLAMKDFILDERGRELYWEGWRRMDLIRHNKFIAFGQKMGWPSEDHMVRFPIPPNVIIASRGVVENNPGYE